MPLKRFIIYFFKLLEFNLSRMSAHYFNFIFRLFSRTFRDLYHILVYLTSKRECILKINGTYSIRIGPKFKLGSKY